MRWQGFHTIGFFTLLKLCPGIETSLICLRSDCSLFKVEVDTSLTMIECMVMCTAWCGRYNLE